jgi:hypothetical protein
VCDYVIAMAALAPKGAVDANLECSGEGKLVPQCGLTNLVSSSRLRQKSCPGAIGRYPALGSQPILRDRPIKGGWMEVP